jgi:hypothetical protein
MESRNNTDAASIDKISVVNNTGINHADSKKVPPSSVTKLPKWCL